MTSTKPTALFWVLAALFLVWNMFGCFIYLVERLGSEEMWLAMENGEAIVAAHKAYPIWASAAHAIAVWGGLLAAIMLLLKKKLSAPLFVLSLISAIICFIPTFTMAEMKAAGGATYWVMPVIVALLGVFEVIWSRAKVSDGTLT